MRRAKRLVLPFKPKTSCMRRSRGNNFPVEETCSGARYVQTPALTSTTLQPLQTKNLSPVENNPSASADKRPQVVSPIDGEDALQEQWGALVAAVQQKDTVLLFHLRNHYAVIAG